MKNFKTLLFTVIALVFFLNVATAQSDKKAEKKKEKVYNVEKKGDVKVEVMKQKMKNASPEEQQKIRKEMDAYKTSKSDNGNAYGNNKGDLEGKDFGQTRPMSAREKIDKGYNEITESKIKMEKSLNAIRDAEARLEKSIMNNEISEEDIKIKREKIAKARLELKEADEAINRKSKLLEQQRQNINKKQ